VSPWTAFLESLHSAWVDELNERLPGIKPELGMPIRQKVPAFPSAEVASTVICEVGFVREEASAAVVTGGSGESRGFAMLALDVDARKKLGLEPRAAWDALMRRAGGEFGFRKISPRIGTPQEAKTGAASGGASGGASILALPAGFVTPGRVIWIPFRLHPGVSYLGVGA
jgi:hypothetical protein